MVVVNCAVQTQVCQSNRSRQSKREQRLIFRHMKRRGLISLTFSRVQYKAISIKLKNGEDFMRAMIKAGNKKKKTTISNSC